MGMGVEIGLRGGIGLGVFDLLIDRVGVDHHATPACQVMIAQPGGSAQIEQGVGALEEIRDAFARKAMIPVLDRVPIGPAVPEPETLHEILEIGDVGRVVVGDAVEPGIVGVGAVILDIPGLEAQALEAEQIMQRLPGDAGQRHLPREMQHHHPPARRHAQNRSEYFSGPKSGDNSRAPGRNWRKIHNIAGVAPPQTACYQPHAIDYARNRETEPIP